MHDDIERQLERLAGRGEVRGADDAWQAARARAGAPAPKRSVALGLTAVAVAGAAIVSAVALASDDQADDRVAAPTTTSTSGAPSIVIAQNASSLVLFDSCASVLDELEEEALERVGPYGLDGIGLPFFFHGEGDFAAGGLPDPRRTSGLESIEQAGSKAAAPASSETNTQEAGIDEPDLVETDGRRLFDVRGGTLRVVDAASAELTATLPLGLVNVDGAVLVGDVLAVFANEPLSSQRGGEAKVVLVDVSSAPTIGERLTVDGFLVDARVVDGRVHVVTVSSPSIAFTYPTTGDQAAQDAATEANKERIRSSILADWLPSRTVTAADGSVVEDGAQLTDCGEIRRPKTFAGFEQTTLLTLDLDDLARSTSTSVQASSLLVYGSAESLYTATTSYDDFDPATGARRPASGEPHTDLHRFSLGATPTYSGSGQVAGYVREQFGLSEHEGHLRVASSTFDGAAKSRVTVLRLAEGELVETGVVDGLGPNESIEGVRFVGDLGYVVTFRQTDPLHVVDLRDPAAPRLAGELKIPGYSRYLHPVGDGLLLGVGHDGTDDGRLTGAAVSLFDVSEPDAPKRIDLEAFGVATTPGIETDHHAFTWWPDTATAYVPIGAFDAGSRVEIVQVQGGALTQVGEVVPAGEGAPAKAAFDRAVIVGDRLLSVSPEGVQVSDAATFAPIAWVPFG